jgi:hypothetical protein
MSKNKLLDAALAVLEFAENDTPIHPVVIDDLKAAVIEAQPDRIVRKHRLSNAEAYWCANGETGIMNIVLANLPEGVRLVGNGTCPAPLGVKLSGRYAMVNELVSALELAIATVELHTGNGAQTQPAWPRDKAGNVSYEAVAKYGRDVLGRAA